MSHPVNDEIFERLYEEVKEEFPNEHPAFIVHEVRKRFEELSQWLIKKKKINLWVNV